MVNWALRHLDRDGNANWLFFRQKSHLRQHVTIEVILAKGGPHVPIHELEEPAPSPLHTLPFAEGAAQQVRVTSITNCRKYFAQPMDP